MPMNPREQIYGAGQSILAGMLDLQKTAPCPDCHQLNLEIQIHNKCLAVVCTTPSYFDLDTNAMGMCGFNAVIKPTELSRPPFTFGFSITKEMKPAVVQRSVARKPAAKPTAKKNARKTPTA